MSLEQFKKQGLLLHSEQRTLDVLSSGFNDRYTVHCATSGSEALNTLGETQIDVSVRRKSVRPRPSASCWPVIRMKTWKHWSETRKFSRLCVATSPPPH